MVTGFWTLLTLRFYRLWAKTRLRRLYWSAIRPGGQPVEYTGDGSEKLARFFMAVSVLAFWLGVVNLILMFASLAIWPVPGIAYGLSTAGLIPIWFLARYRARSVFSPSCGAVGRVADHVFRQSYDVHPDFGALCYVLRWGVGFAMFGYLRPARLCTAEPARMVSLYPYLPNLADMTALRRGIDVGQDRDFGSNSAAEQGCLG